MINTVQLAFNMEVPVITCPNTKCGAVFSIINIIGYDYRDLDWMYQLPNETTQIYCYLCGTIITDKSQKSITSPG